jgi:hypothetical protein
VDLFGLWLDNLGLESFAKRMSSSYTIKLKIFPPPLSFISFMYGFNLITIQ